VPASKRKLAPENVAFRPLRETVSVVTTAVAWNPTREDAMVEAAVARTVYWKDAAEPSGKKQVTALL
jgi:hypothetical protein